MPEEEGRESSETEKRGSGRDEKCEVEEPEKERKKGGKNKIKLLPQYVGEIGTIQTLQLLRGCMKIVRDERSAK